MLVAGVARRVQLRRFDACALRVRREHRRAARHVCEAGGVHPYRERVTVGGREAREGRGDAGRDADGRPDVDRRRPRPGHVTRPAVGAVGAVRAARRCRMRPAVLAEPGDVDGARAQADAAAALRGRNAAGRGADEVTGRRRRARVLCSTATGSGWGTDGW